MLPDPPAAPDVDELARVLRMEAAVARVARVLAAAGGKVMPLKGPVVQRRLLGTSSAYQSADVDVLVSGIGPRSTRRLLTASGWEFSPANGRLWRLDGAAAFRGYGVQLDVHWGLHVGLVSARRMRPLARDLWAGAELLPRGWYEPPIDALAAYLVLQLAHKPGHEGKRLLADAALTAGGGWPRVIDLSARCGMEGVGVAMELAMNAEPMPHLDVLALTYGDRRARTIRLVRSRTPAAIRKLIRRARPR